MPNPNALLTSFKETSHQISGHGRRRVQILKEALADAEEMTDADYYGQGVIIEEFQNKIAEYLGKESAVFFPSGTMAQQIALRIWCDQKNLHKVAYHPLCHLEIHEEGGLRHLHHIEPILLGAPDRLIDLADVVNLPESVAVLLLELPQREIGGQLPPFETLQDIAQVCRERGIVLHLDGARLFEVLPYYQKTAAEVSALFESVYVSFYKGIGGIAGAILAGPKPFTGQAKIWKRRHGGDLISLYPYILAADYFFHRRVNNMARYYAQAQELAARFNRLQGVWTMPLVPVSNMFHVYIDLPKEQVEAILEQLHRATAIGLTGVLREQGTHSCSFEVSVGDQLGMIPELALRDLFDQFNTLLLDAVRTKESVD
ncbi:MAG: low specificity L-threonine aldolase [Sulfobacillus thermosulfidooxidans]|nr:MAG: low specificity L-threonine aldolase [Sulfobacillus thermosulfidooxidans]